MIPSHPSGRPIRRHEEKRLSIIRNPGKGALIERLRDPKPVDAIGFHHHIAREDERDE